MFFSKNTKPIFGSSTKRFGKITMHPGLDSTKAYTDFPIGCNPALYNPQSIDKIFEVNKYRKNNKDRWKYEKDLEEWAKNLGYRNQSILRQRKWRQSILGPAWTDIKDIPHYEPACKNVVFGRTLRFKPMKSLTPGPGTYFKPNLFKLPNGSHSSRPTFEREEPCRFKDSVPNWCLAPNRYTIVDKESIEQKPMKLVSLRGPYDLFTGNRDSSTIKNHFNTSSKCSAMTWPLMLKGSLEKYNKSHYGTLNKSNRSKPYRGRNALVDLAMCCKRPEEPGPAHYNLDKPKIFKKNRKGFNSSYDKPPGYKRIIVWPGVGRYQPTSVSCGVPGHGHKHIFLSKQGRTIGAILPRPMNTF